MDPQNNIAAFLRLEKHAAAFCDDIDQLVPPLEILASLAALFAGAVALPSVTADFTYKDVPQPTDSYALWKSNCSKLETLFPQVQYRSYFHPWTETGDPVTGSIVDDLADVYRDLQPGVAALRAGRRDLLTAIWWDWQFNFTCHWGEHAAAALNALYHLLIFHKD